MTIDAASVLLWSWPVCLMVAFRGLGGRAGTLIGMWGGLLFLPSVQRYVGPIPVDKRTMTGVGLLLGSLVARPELWWTSRPSWRDLPIVGFAAAPLLGLFSSGPEVHADVLDLSVQRALGWVVPYLMGRWFFADRSGPDALVRSMVWAGLAYAPLCIYEEVVGPDRYLSGLLFGTHYRAEMVNRLGGYRPEVFLTHGLELATLMALFATAGAWRLAGLASARRTPTAWASVIILVLVSISCRGVYGYIILAAGLTLLAFTASTRSVVPLLAIGILSPAYMVARATHAWDGRFLETMASWTGRASTVGFRLDAEDRLLDKIAGESYWIGHGEYVWHARGLLWPDGLWLNVTWFGGVVGLSAYLIGLFLFPAGHALYRTITASRPRRILTPTVALAVWLLLQLTDGLHNTSQIFVAGCVAGVLVGRDRNNLDDDPSANPSGSSRHSSTGRPRLIRSARIAAWVIGLAVLEWLGLRSR